MAGLGFSNSRVKKKDREEVKDAKKNGGSGDLVMGKGKKFEKGSLSLCVCPTNRSGKRTGIASACSIHGHG